jgi:hypothetical protein
MSCSSARFVADEQAATAQLDDARLSPDGELVSNNVPTSRHHGAPKHGDALLAGLIRCAVVGAS